MAAGILAGIMNPSLSVLRVYATMKILVIRCSSEKYKYYYEYSLIINIR